MQNKTLGIFITVQNMYFKFIIVIINSFKKY